MQVNNLQGALLDYWTARAEGIPAEDLFFHRAPYTGEVACASRHVRAGALVSPREHVLRYSTDWAQGGPLIDKHRIEVLILTYTDWLAQTEMTSAPGDTPLQAICRAVVRAAFGDEVEEVAVS